tara:strand:+ start:301 stop:459 length:159 start_codon:yes stop_codon:yes gene_type:complete
MDSPDLDIDPGLVLVRGIEASSLQEADLMVVNKDDALEPILDCFDDVGDVRV